MGCGEANAADGRRAARKGHISYSLKSSQGGCIRDDIGDYCRGYGGRY